MSRSIGSRSPIMATLSPLFREVLLSCTLDDLESPSHLRRDLVYLHSRLGRIGHA